MTHLFIQNISFMALFYLRFGTTQRGAPRYCLLTEPMDLAAVQSPLQERDPKGIQVQFHSKFNVVVETNCELVWNPLLSVGNFSTL